jgi:prepilin-type N-terminal cleavage/methylation domain-containing protein
MAMAADTKIRGMQKNAGFSLIELAVVLMIIGTLMSGVLVAVSQSMANARITDARAQLREVEEALYGFAQATGRLPCPATDASTNRGFEEAPCNALHGFVPAGTLGLRGPVDANGLLMDPWGNPLRYSVMSAGTAIFTDAGSIRIFFNNMTSLPALFSICADNTCANRIHTDIPAVVLSLGPNGKGFSSTNETLNAGSQAMNGHPIKANTDLDFVSTTFSEENFDDQVVWLSPYILFNRMVSAGKLP